MSDIQTFFEFAIEYRTPASDEPNGLKICKGQVALLVALMAANTDGTLDLATAKLSETFTDGGKWRGQIPSGLYKAGIIERVGADNSKRQSRKGGLLRRWRLVDPMKASKKIEALKRTIERLTAINSQHQNEKGGRDYGK